MSELEVAWPPTPPLSTTNVRRPSEAPYTAADRPAGPAPTMTMSNSMRSSSTGAPAANAISALVGFPRTVPLGSTMNGSSVPFPASATRARPSAESARQNLWSIAHCWRVSRSSYARPAHDSPTTRIVYGASRWVSAHSSSIPEIV